MGSVGFDPDTLERLVPDELTADRLWLVADGRVRPYDGDLDDFVH